MKASVCAKQSAAFLGFGMGVLGVSFVVIHGIKYGNLNISPRQWQVLGSLSVAWFAVSLMQNLPAQLRGASLRKGLSLLFRTNLILIFLLSLVVNALQLMHWSRFMVYGSVSMFWLLQATAFIVYRSALPETAQDKAQSPHHRPRNISYPLATVDFMLLAASFLATTILKRNEVAFYSPYNDILALGCGLWLVTALMTRKFERANFANSYEALAVAFKSIVLFSGMLAFLIFALRIGPVSRIQVFGAVGLYFLFEGLLFFLFARYRTYKGMRDIEDVSLVQEFLRSQQQELPPPTQDQVCDPAREKLMHALEFMFPELFPFLDRQLALKDIDRCQCALMSTKDLLNFNTLVATQMRLIVNLHKLNDMRWFNRYFLMAHSRLQSGGYLVGKVHTVGTRRSLYAERFPRPLDSILYGLNFLWCRACPKLPWMQKIYFALTKGENRIVSRTEVLGRLYFCGFEVVAETEINHRFFFIARKVRTPSEDRNPTYGPLVRLQRSGLGGRPITVYKFRTMFPFSEYLQAYVYQHNALATGGKFKEDFRVTGWGRFMRRMWLDELPMLYNWLRGDLKLVGVRPLSSQYLKLYDPDLQVLRKQVKPGLIPPFYADMPRTLEEIQESERRYIQSYLNRPSLTQLDYLRRCFWNIVILQKRSA